MTKVIPQSISEILLISPKIYPDDRGFFLETSRKSVLDDLGLPDLVQHNQSRSKFGILRGLHYQLSSPQGKLVRCSYGKIFDVAVDIRKTSPTFGKYVSAILDDQNHNQLWIPSGFAHGFLVLSEYADVIYLSSNYYDPQSETGIIWDDKEISINWPNLPENYKIELSEKDKALSTLSEQIKNNKVF